MDRSDLTVLEGGKMDKKQALEHALAQIDKLHGKGSIMRLGANDKVDIEAISTGSLGLDIALGIGGLPKGRVIEIYGPESSGKTTLTLAGDRGGSEEGRHLRFHRRRACARSDLCQEARRQGRGSSDFAARHRRAGARDRRHAGALRRHRRARHRLGCGADPESRARGRDGRHAARNAGAPHEQGVAQAHRRRSPNPAPWSSSSTRSA